MSNPYEPIVESPGGSVEEKPKPSRDLRRILVDLWRRAWMVVVVIMLAVGAGWLAGKRMSKATWETDTSLMFHLNEEKKNDVDPQKDLMTLKEIVKVRSNLEEVREKLGLEMTLQQLGGSVEVEVGKNTNLMTISATSGTPEGAADLANAVRDAFLKNQIGIDRTAAQQELGAQNRRRDAVLAELAKADLAVRLFTDKHHITDFVSMARAYLEGYNSVDLLYQSAMVDRQTNIEQRQNLDRIVNDQKGKVMKEREKASALVDMTTLSTKIERLRAAIHDDQELRGRQADLAMREVELASAKRLYADGAIAKKKVDEAQSAYDKQKALTVDTDQVKVWRTELKKLEDTVLPTGSEGPAAQLLQTMLIRDFEVQLQSVAIESKVASFKAGRDEYERKLSELPDLQREFTILQRKADALDEEKKTLDDKIAKQKRLLEIRTPDFITVSEAKPPTVPKSSNKKTMTIMATVAVLLFGLVGVVGTIFLDARLKSKGDLQGASNYPVLAELPSAGGFKATFPPSPDSELAVRMSALSRAIRRGVPQNGARIAVAGVHEGDGASAIAASLATALSRQGENVLLAAFGEQPNAVSYCLAEPKKLDWVADLNGSGLKLADLTIAGSGSVPNTLPVLPNAVHSDLIASLPMRAALEEASIAHDIVMLDVLPASESLQVQLLGSFCDGVVLVTRSMHLKRENVKRVESDLEAAGVRVIGWVMNGVPKLYQEPV